MTTQLVLDALEQAIWTRQRVTAAGDGMLTSVVAHSARGSQYTAVKYGERLAEAGIAASVGSVGDSFDNALAETINGLYKTELIKPGGPGRASTTLRSPPPSGSIGSTTADSTSTAETSRPPSSRLPTTINISLTPPAEVTHQRVSGHAGAVQSVATEIRSSVTV